VVLAMKESRSYAQFQGCVEEYLIRHRSILDVLSKLQESAARTQRAVTKAVTTCGCVRVEAEKAVIPPDITYPQLKEHMDTHLRGQLCEVCRDVIETEMGQNLFYLAALCTIANLDMEEILRKQCDRLKTLGNYYLS
jgi:hypothetical protein